MLLPQAEDEKKWFQKCLANKELVEKIKKIKLVVCDVDGAMTDGHVYLTDDKYSVKGFSVQNGFIISRIIKNNLLHLALVSGRNDAVTTRRAKMYGIPDDMCFVGIDTKKIEKVREIQNNKQISKDETLFYGDDILDFETKSGVGLFANPANARFFKASSSLFNGAMSTAKE